MNKTLTFLGAAATIFVASQAFAADGAAIPAGVFLDTQSDTQYLAKDELIGVKIHDKDGQIIGDIEDLILSDANIVEGIVMGTGGFLGMGEKRIGVALTALQYTNKDGKTIVMVPEATKETLAALPAFGRSKAKKSLLTRAMEKAKELSDKGKVTAGDAYKDAAEKAAPTLEKAKQKASEAYSAAKETAKDALDKAKDAAAPPAETPAETPATE